MVYGAVRVARAWACVGLVAMVILLGTSYGRGQSVAGPSLLPSMVSAEQYIAEEISEPWSPPTLAEQPFSPPPLVGPTVESRSTPIEASTTPAPEEELPVPESSSDGDEVLVEVELDSDELIDLEAPWYVPQRWFTPLPWDTGLELGLNGSSGNNESLSVRTGGYMKRESRFSKLDMSAYYNKTTTRDQTTQNNASVDIRNDWLLDDTSPWTLYGTTNLFYDEFQVFDVQVSANTGLGYRFVYRPELNLIGRFGGGTSRKFGGPDDRWVPESLFGIEYNQRIGTNQKLYGKLDYFPEWEEFGEYRMVADVGWEVELVEPENLSLKISAMDRYESSPSGVDPHLINYSVLLLLKL